MSKSETVSLSELSVCLQASWRLVEPTVSGVVKFRVRTRGCFRSLGESQKGSTPSGNGKTVTMGAGPCYNLVYLTPDVWAGAPSLFQHRWSWLSNSVNWFLPHGQEHLVSVTGPIKG